jgi:hypothetical protein
VSLVPFRVLVAWAACLMGLATDVAAQEADTLEPTITDDAAGTELPNPLALKPLPSIDAIQQEEDARSKRPAKIVDPYAPQGIDTGGLRLFPSIEMGAETTSNVAQSPDDATSAVGLAVKPGLRLQSDWSRHELTGQAVGDFVFFPKHSENDRRALDADANFRLDIRHTTKADFGAFYTLDQAGRENSDVPDAAAERRTDQTFGARVALTQDLGGIVAAPRLGLAREIFSDVKLVGGGTEDNSDRNLIAPSAGLRLTYADPPVIKPFIDVSTSYRIHDDRRDRNGFKRDALDLDAQVGVVIENGPLWAGEVAVGYLHRAYEDPALDDVGAFGINGNLTWRPGELTRIVLSAGTNLDDTTAAGSTASRIYTARLDATQALRENLDLFAGGGVSLEKFDGATDKTYDATLGLNWQLTPDWAWTASYDATWFRGANSAEDYTEHRILTGIVLRR